MKLAMFPRVRADVEDFFLCKLYACSCVHLLAIHSTTRHSAKACEGCDYEAKHSLLGPVLLTY